jgi:hypothetical protein
MLVPRVVEAVGGGYAAGNGSVGMGRHGDSGSLLRPDPN